MLMLILCFLADGSFQLESRRRCLSFSNTCDRSNVGENHNNVVETKLDVSETKTDVEETQNNIFCV